MDTVKPKVSVIVPVYGVEKFIEKCARSLFDQTFRDVEYIFVDDCTKDGSISVLESVMAEYPELNVRIVRKEQNGGLPQARRSGLLCASGDYILHIDSDDWVESNMIETLYNKAMETGAEMVICNWVEEYLDHQEVKTQPAMNRDDYYHNILSLEAGAYVWSRLVKRSLYEGVEFPTYNMFEDYVITSQLLANCKQVAFVSDVLYHYLRYNVNSIRATAEKKRILTQEIHNIFLVYNRVKDQFPADKKSRALGRMLFAMGWHAMRRRLYCHLSDEECAKIKEGVLIHLPNRKLGFSYIKQLILYIGNRLS